MTRTTRPLLALSLGAVLLLAACGSSGSGRAASGATTTTAPSTADATTTTAASSGGRYGSSSATTTSPTTIAAASSAVVRMTTTKLGLTLVDASGHTLYQYQPDPKGSSTCTGGCATAWPPLTTTAATVTVAPPLTASLFSTLTGADGSHIVAISGHPLYRFSGDTAAGQTNGQGVGGVWHAAGPLGNTM